MTFKEFYISDKNGKSNCVIRSLCKILNKEYNDNNSRNERQDISFIMETL